MRQAIRRYIVKCIINSDRSGMNSFKRVEQSRAKILCIAENTIVQTGLPDEIIVIASSHGQSLASFSEQEGRVPGHIGVKYKFERGIGLLIRLAHKREPAVQLKLIQYTNRLCDFLLLQFSIVHGSSFYIVSCYVFL